MEFKELAARRHSLQDFCQQHAGSVLQFRCERGSFKLWITEPELDRPARHLTTTATCIESLLDCPARYREGHARPDELARQFARDALDREDWMSEGSAEIYCRCRALPLVVQHLAGYDPRVETHLERIFHQLEDNRAPGRFAIGETAPPKADGRQEDDPNKWYPPNAFHTYWTLELLGELQRAKPADWYRDVSGRLRLEDRRRSMVLWARHALALQVSLHAAESSVLDTDQLGWSLAVVLKFGEFGEEFHFDLAEQDFIREAVRRLFQTQLDVGTWRRYRSLFHYRDAGNAYCYVFETFAVLLKIALTQGLRTAQFFRQCLRDHAPKLVKLWEYADRTRIKLPERDADPKLIGWRSGHRINQRDPEGWATASVFSFAQNLRRLLGIWTRDEALKRLNVRIPEAPTAEDALRKMADRGDTCGEGPAGVADQLCTMFVNPILKSASGPATDPDNQPIAEDQARSAILFGPPGTSKTSLARCVAAAVGWDYVEVHASDFVRKGLPHVQRTADEIFNQLMELDRTVVLFDEIDELVREREQEHDAFGRFLTTSMLPKLAELWRQRKVVYFVATNHIRYFDVAITRSQRFDALIFIGTPSHRAKLERLGHCIGNCLAGGPVPSFEEFESAVTEKLEAAAGRCAQKRDEPLPDNLVLAKFALLRHDQLEELAHLLCDELRRVSAPRVSREMIEAALRRVADQRLRKCAPYVDFVADRNYQRRDHEKTNTWRIRGLDPAGDYPEPIVKDKGELWIIAKTDVPSIPVVLGYRAERRTLGIVEFVRELKG